MVTVDLNNVLPPLYLCDPQDAIYEDWLFCRWNGTASPEDLLFTVYTDHELHVGDVITAGGTTWTITAKGNGWLAQPTSGTQ